MKEFRGRKNLRVFFTKKEYTGTRKTMSAECSTKEKIHVILIKTFPFFFK